MSTAEGHAQRGETKIIGLASLLVAARIGARLMKGELVALLFLLLCLGLTSAASAAETIQGPVEAKLVRVIDGDTFVAEVHLWLGLRQTVHIRIAGLDAPELNSKDPDERAAAIAAKEALEKTLTSGTITLTNIHYGKFARRVIARVRVDTPEPGAL